MLKYTQNAQQQQFRRPLQEGNASKHKPKVKHDAAALQPPTPGSASRIRWVLVGLSSVILTAISAYCLVQVALQAPLWNVQFMLYPYSSYWIWLRPSYPAAPDDHRAQSRIQLKYWCHSTLFVTYYVTLLPLQFLTGGDHLYFSVEQCCLCALYCLMNTAVILMAQCVALDLGLNVARANTTVGYFKRQWGYNAKGSKASTWDANTPVHRHTIVQYNGAYYKAEGWMNTAKPGSWSAWLYWNLFRNTDRCPRTLIFFQASVTFILLPPLIFTRQWVLYCTLLCLNYILLLWCIHLRKTLLQRTLPQARHLANNSFSALASLTDVTYAAGAKVS
jgi:hypothetical protein